MGLQALIFGASGIGGWAIAHEALVYPKPTTFDRIIALTKRPLTKEEALFPKEDSRLELHPGINLAKDLDTVVEGLKTIHGIEKTTHIYFCAYTAHGAEFSEVKRANLEILTHAMLGVEQLCPELEFVSLQTGGKAYGVEFPDQLEFKAPFKESMPRISGPLGDNIFYYPQVDFLAELSKGKKWSYAEIRPDAIIGFVPNNNAMNIAQILGLFLSMYASVEGPGAEVPFPGTEKAWTSLRRDTSQDVLARFSIYTSLISNRSLTHSRTFNITDEAIVSWDVIWPQVCAYFGLKGTGPSTSDEKLKGAKWMLAQKDSWEAWVRKNNLKEGVLEATVWEFIDLLMTLFDFDKQLDLGEARKLGFGEETDTMDGYRIAWARMKEAGIIPVTQEPL